MKSFRVLLSVLTVVGLTGCESGTRSNDSELSASAAAISQDFTSETGQGQLISGEPLATSIGGTERRFQKLDAQTTGVDFMVPIDTNHPLKRLYVGGFFCGGIAIGDVDGDGAPDLYLISGPEQNRLYRNTGDFHFEDVTDRAQVGGGDAWGVGASMVDIDNDGDLDIYVCNYDSPNLLYVNQGDGRFVESAKRFGLDLVDSCLLPAFCDYDRDGDMDCYVLTNQYYRDGGLPRDLKLITKGGRLSLPREYDKYYTIRTTGRNRGEIEFIGRPDRLLQNNGDGTFTDVSRQAGISREPEHGLSATWWDYNADGLCDLYVGNDFNDPDHLYRNNGDGTFSDVIKETVPHTTWFSMGADVGDVNNDGLFDFFIADMSATTHFGEKTTMGAMGKHTTFLETARPPQYMRNALFLNTRTPRFMEVAYLSGLASSDWTWSVRLADLDNDGRQDAYITNGMSRNLNDSDLPFTLGDQLGGNKWDLYEKLPAMRQQNLAFRNLGDLRFEDVSRQWGLDHVGMSFAAATGDLDRDGDLDLVVANLQEPVSIYRNQSAGGHRLLLRLKGTRGNRWGIGAIVRIQTAMGTQVRQLMPTTGYLASSEPVVHFGLGEERDIRELTVSWPGGNTQSFENLAADRLYTITEPAGTEDEPSTTDTAPTLFRPCDTLAEFRHRETKFDDYRRQPLLPYKLSQLGPGLAVADVDGDGDEDLFVSGAAGQTGMLCLNHGSGHFAHGSEYPFHEDAACEDMAPLFFDADGDGDADLYVASGGVECEPGDERLADRLYLNDGRGNFVKAAAGTLPDVLTSTGTVAASDFDHDGDLDLFIGGRVIPGDYPMSPRSLLLRNDGGTFRDVTEQVAPALAHSGLVTSAIWSDADSDGWPDLLVAHEWGPVKLFANQHGTLVDRTDAANLAKYTGWWNGITGRDLDGDGDIDYVATNFGTNTKYHASLEKPTLLYYGDFERTGRKRLVEAEYEGQTLFPVRGRSCSTNAMPFLGNRFTSYKSFAMASLQDIYSAPCLDEAHRFEATTLESGVFLNEGGRFDYRPLPRLAQASPAFGLALTDVDVDGHADLYIVQNFFSPQVETGRMDGGLSLLLHGNGDGSFEPTWPGRSGLIVPGDAKSLAVTDLNGDGFPDFVVGVNDAPVQTFQHTGECPGRLFTVRLAGPPGNPTAIGARVTVRLDSGLSQTAEVHAGSGYLSQSTGALTFGLGRDGQVSQIEVVWPDGSRSQHTPPSDTTATVIRPTASR